MGQGNSAAGMSGGLIGLVCVVGIIGWLLLGGDGSGGGGAIDQQIKTKDLASKSIWESEIKRLLKGHEAMNGSFPEYLEDLEGVRVLPEGWRWDYDPETGSARIERKIVEEE